MTIAEVIRSSTADPASRAAQKRLGKFYTPQSVANAITDWALRDATDRLLDPSYGGCAFFSAGLRRLLTLGSLDPSSQLYGVDVDELAASYLGSLPGLVPESPNFRTADFLQLSPATLGVRFQAIVGNPPYVRHHALTDAQIEDGQRAVQRLSAALPRTAGYWAYFVLHSLAFLAPGGRLAFVLPAAFLNAVYAGAVRAALADNFSTVRVALVGERVFPDVEEAAVIVLAEGFGDRPRGSTLSSISSVNDLESWCTQTADTGRSFQLRLDGNGWKKSLLSEETLSLLDTLVARGDVVSLGELARLRIGVVTGANHFFVLCPNDAARLRLPESVLRTVLDSGRRLSRLTLTRADVARMRKSEAHCLLFVAPPDPTSVRALSYTESDSGKAAASAGKCRIRKPWYSLRDVEPPDAFLTYVNGRAPKLVLNPARALCTNAIHRVWWKEQRSSRAEKTLALSFLTSLTGLSAEIHGRSCGGGALKLEPGEAARVLLATARGDSTSLKETFKAASCALESGDWPKARSIADRAILGHGLGLTASDILQLSRAQDELHDLRVLAAWEAVGKVTHQGRRK